MEVVVACCAGLDVHQASVVACVNRTGGGGRSHKEVRSFGTMRDDLIALHDWLKQAGVTMVAMESTGVYWKPVYEALEHDFDTIVVNAQHIKNVPGRKTDVKDCEWISDLLRHGLIRPGFVPPRELRDIRELSRFRRKLTQLQAGERNRLIKLLETAGIKLAGVASDVFGVSGRAMIRALIEGEHTPQAMAGLARGKLRGKRKDLARALDVSLKAHQRFMLCTQLARIEQAEADLQRIDITLRKLIAPYADYLRLLMSIPGVDWIIAVTIIAEIGIDMSAFASPRASRFLDRHLSRQQRKRRQEAIGKHPQGQRLPEDCSGHGGDHRLASPRRHLSRREIPPPRRQARQDAGGGRDRP